MPHEDTVGYVANFCFGGCFVVETDCVAHLLSHCDGALVADAVRHADGCHSSGLCDDNIDLIDRFLCSISILFYFQLIFDDICSDYIRIHHVLWQLCRFTRTSITSHDAEVTVSHGYLDTLFILEDGKTFSEAFNIHFLFIRGVRNIL